MKRSPLNRTRFKKKKPSEESLRKKVHKKTWGLMSEWIRLRDGRCVTCGSVVNLQAGHFIHGCLDFDEVNINAQCRRCNYFKSGNLSDYAVYLEGKYGFGILQELRDKSRVISKPTVTELESIIEVLKQKINTKKKGIKSLMKVKACEKVKGN